MASRLILWANDDEREVWLKLESLRGGRNCFKALGLRVGGAEGGEREGRQQIGRQSCSKVGPKRQDRRHSICAASIHSNGAKGAADLAEPLLQVDSSSDFNANGGAKSHREDN